MIISFLKEKYPIAKWESVDKEETFFTFGWNEFSKSLKRYGIYPGNLSSQWRHENETREAVQKFLMDGRAMTQIDDWTISDGALLIYNNLAKEYNLGAKIIRVFDSEETREFYTLSLLHECCIPELFFTAQEKHRNNILAGKQPIRWIDYYRSLEENMAKQSQHGSAVFDHNEGFSNITNIGSISEGNFLASKITIRERALNAIIFSFHTNEIDDEARGSFGEDTYKIVDLQNWVKNILQTTTEYFKTMQTSKHPLIGIIAYLGPVNYVASRATLIERGSQTDLSEIIRAEKGAKVRMQDVRIFKDDNAVFEEFFNEVKTSMFTKDQRYASQSEWRLCIMGIVANHEGCGYLSPHNRNLSPDNWNLSPDQRAYEFMAENLASEALDLIIQG